MQRLTISMDDDLAATFDRYIVARGYGNRSEAMRDLVRDLLARERMEEVNTGPCLGSLTYIYNHHERELSRRLTEHQHTRHDLALSTMHVHVDQDNCMETVILRGTVAEVRHFAGEIMARPGVRHGSLHLIPLAQGAEK
ncbi:MAG: nickel-responsive transcriptional regulator NikR [Magnetococcales bacterium]|nr:nickel-responsive transcriptional regulator NikR [Magnetococcales bacterium]